MRRDKDNYYLDIAEVVLERSTCLRRQYGAIIVNNDEIISTGYTGSPRGKKNCCDVGECERIKNNVPHGTDYTSCNSVHAEMNAIISASRKDMIGSTLYLVGIEGNNDFEKGNWDYVKDTQPCSICKRLIINSGIEKVIVRTNKDEFKTIEIKL